MRYYLDTEFHERPCTIELMSIGIVDDQGRCLYRESSEFDRDLAEKHPFLSTQVLPYLGKGAMRPMPRSRIAKDIKKFIGDDQKPEFWGYFCDYDWVVFCWLFGPMVALPSRFPFYCRDLKQLMDERGISKEDLPEQESHEHHALADAMWIRRAHHKILAREAQA